MRDFLVFDLETQRSAQEVGGWDNIDEMKVSVGVIWDSAKEKFFTYYEEQVEQLIEHLKSGPVVIGYNHIGFDYKVLTGYYPKEERALRQKEFEELANLDLLLAIREVIGKKVKLDAVARPTLKVGKSADGLLALDWYKEYLAGDESKLKMIADYCTQDVAVTRDVYLYGLEHGELLYQDREKGIRKFAITWFKENQAQGPADDHEQLSFF